MVLGLTNARNPGALANAEHHDASCSTRGMDGVPLTFDFIIPNSTVATAVDDDNVIRVFNTTGTVQYIWAGLENAVPGTIDITTGMALAPNEGLTCYVGHSYDPKVGLMVKSSDAGVQVIIYKN